MNLDSLNSWKFFIDLLSTKTLLYDTVRNTFTYVNREFEKITTAPSPEQQIFIDKSTKSFLLAYD